MGAERAVWQTTFRAKDALLDLVMAFEKPPTMLRQCCYHARSRLVHLVIVFCVLLAPRGIGIHNIYSRMVFATCGITAGTGFGATELRLQLLHAIDEAKDNIIFLKELECLCL